MMVVVGIKYTLYLWNKGLKNNVNKVQPLQKGERADAKHMHVCAYVCVYIHVLVLALSTEKAWHQRLIR